MEEDTKGGGGTAAQRPRGREDRDRGLGGTGHSELGWSRGEVKLRKAGTQATQALGPSSGGVWRGEVEAPDPEELMWIWGKTTVKTAGPDWL